jgi:hypothetical protein
VYSSTPSQTRSLLPIGHRAWYRATSSSVQGGESAALRLCWAHYQIDPFDRVKLAEVNAALAATYGYCVIIDGHTLRRAPVQSYCNDPLNSSEVHFASVPGDL